MTPIKIRPASKNDVSSIVAIRQGAFTDEEAAGYIIPGDNMYTSTKKMREMWGTKNLLEDGSEVFVAEREGRVVGFIVFNMKSIDDNIDNVIVAKAEQGSGVGKALVEYVESLAKSRGVDVLRLDTTETVEGVPWRAYGFWIKMGYVDTGERVASGYGFKDIRFVKKLRARSK
jgi:ribosomal protein S18 acetylase RimI-like enzyme